MKQYHEANQVALIYPGENELKQGSFFAPNGSEPEKKCSVISIPTNSTINEWQANIAKQIFDEWLKGRLDLKAKNN